METRDVYFETKVGQIGLKWNKSRVFSDQISVQLHFLLRSDLKVPDVLIFVANLTNFRAKPNIP